MKVARLHDWQLKVAHANKHFLALKREIENFMNSDVYGFEMDPPQHIYPPDKTIWGTIVRLKLRTETPLDDWALMITDIIHNYRSALDILVYQNAVNPGRKTGFPIMLNQDHFVKHSSAFLEGVLPIHREVIEAEQPYNFRSDDPDEDPLAILADLDNKSKHRLIPAAFSAFGIGTSDFFAQDVDEIEISHREPQREDGEELAFIGLRVVGLNPMFRLNPRKKIFIAFGDGSPRSSGKLVYETLVAIDRRVVELITDFESHVEMH